MKRRITCVFLVVVMLTLSLVSCGYSFTKDDMKQYATFDKAKFESVISSLKIEDGEYTADKRDDLKLDNINEALAGKVDKEAKLYEGEVDGNDTVYYSYYITFQKDGKDYTLAPTYMNPTKAVSLQLGISTLEGYKKDLAEKLKDIEMKDYAYSVSTTGTAKDGQIAYINYTITTTKADGGTTDDVNKLVRVVLDSKSTDPVIKKLSEKKTIGTSVESFTEGDKKYSNMKIEYVINETDAKKHREIELDPIVVYTEKTELEATDGKKYDLKDVKLTYHVCPVYFFDVEDLTAEAVLRTLLSSVSVDTFEIFKDHGDLIKAFNDKVTAFDEAEEALADAEEALEDEKDNLEDVKDAVPEGEDVDTNQSVINATAAVAKKQEAVDNAKKDVDTADGEVVKAMDALFTALGKGDNALAAGKTAVIDAYKEKVHDDLVAEYNTEIQKNLAKALWGAMTNKDIIKFTWLPEKAVNEVFDRLITEHEYKFNTGKNSSSVTYYKEFGGNFEKYLMSVTGTSAKTYADAEAEVRKKAETLVTEMCTVYFFADIYGVLLTEDEIKEYKKDASGTYEYNANTYGEMNTLAAYQFDKVFDHFLAIETKEVEKDGEKVTEPVYDENGEYKYTNEFIKQFTIKTESDK